MENLITIVAMFIAKPFEENLTVILLFDVALCGLWQLLIEYTSKTKTSGLSKSESITLIIAFCLAVLLLLFIILTTLGLSITVSRLILLNYPLLLLGIFAVVLIKTLQERNKV